mmetsp:Transcript_59267/g.157679  ORF Transcript_59267/g.157679 Transcript_59267/m.157679 type:complete len:240 (-) Transcript_59267:1952-2671(-)
MGVGGGSPVPAPVGVSVVAAGPGCGDRPPRVRPSRSALDNASAMGGGLSPISVAAADAVVVDTTGRRVGLFGGCCVSHRLPRWLSPRPGADDMGLDPGLALASFRGSSKKVRKESSFRGPFAGVCSACISSSSSCNFCTADFPILDAVFWMVSTSLQPFGTLGLAFGPPAVRLWPPERRRACAVEDESKDPDSLWASPLASPSPVPAENCRTDDLRTWATAVCHIDIRRLIPSTVVTTA